MKTATSFFILLLVIAPPVSTFAFEGRIDVSVTRGGQVSSLLYTAGTNCLRIERADSNRPFARNLVDRQTGDLILLFPHNRTFVRLPAASLDNSRGPGAGGLPPGVGPQGGGPPGMSAMPMMPMPMDKMDLRPTGQTTNLLGYSCAGYEIKQRGQTVQIWATDQLLPFQPWRPKQPLPLGPRLIEEQWGELLQRQKMFPLLATLRFDNGAEQYRFEVNAIRPGHITDDDGTLFQMPTNYFEVRAH